MYNLQPGQGLASSTCVICLGLGDQTWVAPGAGEVDTNVYGGGGKAYVPRFEWDDIIGDIERREQIAREDEEILEIILTAVSSGVLD